MFSKIVPPFTSMSTIALMLCLPSTCLGQPREVWILPNFNSGLQPQRSSTSIGQIRKALSSTLFKTKGYGEEKPFGQFVKDLENAISKMGKEVQIIIENDAFPADDRKERFLIVWEEVITLPQDFKSLRADIALELARSQVGRGNAAIWIRRGEIVVTSDERARSSHFLKSAQTTANAKGRRLVEVLEELSEDTGVSIVVDCRVAKQAQTRIAAKCSGSLEAVVRLLSKSVGLEPVVLNNVIFVTSPANARQFGQAKPDGKLSSYISGASHKNAPLIKAFDNLGESFRFTSSNWSGWVIDSKVKEKTNIRVTAKWQNYVEPDTALRVLTDMAGLRHVVIDNVAYITSPANARKLEEEQSRKMPVPD